MRKTVFLMLFLMSCGATLCSMDLFKERQWQVKGIAVRPDATKSELYAVDELRLHLSKVTGKPAPPMVKDDGALALGGYIYLGATENAGKAHALPEKMPKNYGEILVSNGNIYICGKDDNGNWLWDISQGTLFATYEFLEKFLGIRWLWPGELGIYAPQLDNITLPEGKTIVTPRIAFSRWRTPQASGGWSSKEAAFRFQTAQKVFMKRHRFSWDFSFQHGHAFTNWFKMYGESHPEYFNLLPDGTRRPNPYGTTKGLPQLVSLCPTNTGLAKEIVRLWAANPKHGHVINANENDTGGYCVCDECLKADNAVEPVESRRTRAAELFGKKDASWPSTLGSVSDRYARFFLNIQAEADKIDPESIVFGLAYANYYKAPSPNIKLNNRIVLRYCPSVMYPWKDGAVEEIKQGWKGWGDSGARLLFRPNFTSDGQAFPVQYYREYYEVFTYGVSHGMIGSDLDSCTGCWASQALTNYVVAQTNHDAASLEKLEMDFYQAFGPAKDVVKEYFDFITQVTMHSGYKNPFKGDTIEGGVLFLDMLLVADTLFTPEVMKKSYEILRRAQRVPGLSKDEGRRLVFQLAALDNVRLMMAAQAEFRKYQAGGDIAPFVKAVENLDKFRASVESLNGMNIGYLQYLESRHWPARDILRLHSRNATQLDGWRIRFDPSEIGLKDNWQASETEWRDAAQIGTDSHWEKQPYGMKWKEENGCDYKGVGWYRVEFDLKNPALPHELVFGAVDGTATMYLNGRQIHFRPYPFNGDPNSWRASFTVPIPEQLLREKGNFLVVRVDKRIGLCGIWKPVFVVPSDKKGK